MAFTKTVCALAVLTLVPYGGQVQGQGQVQEPGAFLPLSYSDLIYSLMKRDYVQRQGTEAKPFSALDQALALKRQLHGEDNDLFRSSNDLARTQEIAVTSLANVDDKRIVQGKINRPTSSGLFRGLLNSSFFLHLARSSGFASHGGREAERMVFPGFFSFCTDYFLPA